MIVNLIASFVVAYQVLPIQVATIPISENNFRDNIPENMTYSNADIGLYLFGDFPRALGMLAKIFVFAPITLVLLLGEAGVPMPIISIFSTIVWAVYLVGLAQIIMKYSLEGNS